MRSLVTTAIVLCTLALAALIPTMASASTPAPGPGQKRICLWTDISAYLDKDAGDYLDGNSARMLGARMTVKWFDGLSWITSGWQYADPDDACILINTSNGNSYTITYRPFSQVLDGPDELYVRTSGSGLPTYSFTVTLAAGSSTHHVIAPAKATTRIYASLAHAIQRFTGALTQFRLTAWSDWDGTGTQCASMIEGKSGTWRCTSSDDVIMNIASDPVGGVHNQRKYVIAHEYGHAALNGVNAPNNVSCLPPSCPGGTPNNHRMRSEEFASGAAMEGWAHFIASDVFSFHADGESPFIYLDDGLIDFATGSGNCPDPADMPIAEADPDTYPTNSPARFYLSCTPGTTNEPQIGVELDWARFWWIYHDSYIIVGSPVPHIQLLYELITLGGWGNTDIYSKMTSIVGGTRIPAAGLASGICSSSNC